MISARLGIIAGPYNINLRRMSELLNRVITVALLGFVVSSTIAMGVSLTVRQIFGALRNARLVTLAMLANSVVMPLADPRSSKSAPAR